MKLFKHKISKCKMIIGIIILAILLFWRYSYFIFTPLFKYKKLPQAELSTLPERLRNELKTDGEIRFGDDESMTGESPWGLHGYPFIKEETQRGASYGGLAYTYTSLDYGWKRTFNDYYTSEGGIVAVNQNYIVLAYERADSWRFSDEVSGAFSPIFFPGNPPFYIYFMYNTSKIGWCDLFIINRKTGETVDKFRSKSIFFYTAYLDDDNILYFRTGKEISRIYRIKED